MDLSDQLEALAEELEVIRRHEAPWVEIPRSLKRFGERVPVKWLVVGGASIGGGALGGLVGTMAGGPVGAWIGSRAGNVGGGALASAAVLAIDP